MDNAQAILLSSDFKEPVVINKGHEEFFSKLISIVQGREIDQQLGQEVQDHVLDYVKNNNVVIDNFSDNRYVRNYIGRDGATAWEAILMTWKKGNRTSIHSHPKFASYTICEGKFLIEMFEPVGEDKARLVDAAVVEGHKGFFAIGNEDNFDNHIHRLTCLSGIGSSLHVYSNDALKGKKYSYNE